MISIVVFPGSNCDRDLKVAIEKTLKKKVDMVWHKTAYIKKSDMIFVPGGFSFGDHLRAGILATKSPAMREVERLSKKGVPIIGICNGFQILTETGLLKGTLLRNKNLKFINKDVYVKVINNNTKFSNKYNKNQILKINIAHNEGNYFTNSNHLKELNNENLIAFKYCDDKGNINDKNNPNGSLENIAGIYNKKKNILGMMPHPERMIDEIISGKDGINLFLSLLN